HLKAIERLLRRRISVEDHGVAEYVATEKPVASGSPQGSPRAAGSEPARQNTTRRPFRPARPPAARGSGQPGQRRYRGRRPR
ncbi:MAG: hypothetical protein AB7O38_11510, partial [Pirellulaceae bacterium]